MLIFNNKIKIKLVYILKLYIYICIKNKNKKATYWGHTIPAIVVLKNKIEKKEKVLPIPQVSGHWFVSHSACLINALQQVCHYWFLLLAMDMMTVYYKWHVIISFSARWKVEMLVITGTSHEIDRVVLIFFPGYKMSAAF